jgi:hypothetical protein
VIGEIGGLLFPIIFEQADDPLLSPESTRALDRQDRRYLSLDKQIGKRIRTVYDLRPLAAIRFSGGGVVHWVRAESILPTFQLIELKSIPCH